MVEFAARKHHGPPDLHPPPPKAFVQIKSSQGKRLACRVKLSNALKAVQSRDPWFLVFMIAPMGASAPSVYATHVWREQMEQTLRAARLADAKGKDLHRVTLPISFKETDLRSEDSLVAWMQTCIDNVVPDYSSEKRRIHETVGFEEGYGIGQLSFSEDDENKIYDSFLGLGDGIQLNKFSLTPSRFGILDLKNAINADGGTVHITPVPAGDCEIRLRSSQATPMISIPAKCYTVGEPIVSGERRRFRFSAKNNEIVWSQDGYSNFQVKPHFAERQSLIDLENLATLMSWFALGPVNLQVWAFGGRMVGATIDRIVNLPRFEWEKFVDIVKLLTRLSGSSDLALSVSDINSAARDLYFMHQIVGAPSLMLEFTPLTELPQSADKVLYYASADVGELMAYALIERPLLNFEELGAVQRRIVFGAPRILESWVTSSATQETRAMIEGDYNRAVGELHNSGRPPLELGDIRHLYNTGKGEATT